MKDSGDPRAEDEADQDEQRRQRQEAAAGDAGHKRPDHQQRAEDEQGRLEPSRTDREQQRHLHVRHGHAVRVSESRERSGVRITVLGKSPSWQDAGGACSGYLVQEGVFTAVARLRQRRVLEAAARCGLRRRRRGRDQPSARRPFPRPDPVQLRADLRAPPAARRGRPAGRAPSGRRARSCTHPSARPSSSGEVVGCWGNEDLIERAFDVHEYDAPDEIALGPFARALLRGAPLHADVRGRAGVQRRRAAHLQRRLRPNDELVRFARDTDMLLIEATLPRPERTGERGHLTPGRPASTVAAPAPGASCSRTSPTSWTPAGSRAEAEEAYGGPVELARGRRRLHAVSPAAS